MSEGNTPYYHWGPMRVDVSTMKTPRIIPADNWENELNHWLAELRDWLTDEENIDDVIDHLRDLLTAKHQKYGQNNLKKFGEYGILVRSFDKVERIKNILEMEIEDGEETRKDTWLDLAGYAIQALIMQGMMEFHSNDLHILEKRTNRLKRGICPDCGAGIVLVRERWGAPYGAREFYCSQECGFEFSFGPGLMAIESEQPGYIVKAIAEFPAAKEQK